MPLVEQTDIEKTLVDYLAGLVGSGQVTEIIGWAAKTAITPGVTPVRTIQVRSVGGTTVDRVAHRPRVDFRLWLDGTYLTEGALLLVARKILARLQRDFRTRVVMIPASMPDPADPSKVHVMFTVELLTRGK